MLRIAQRAGAALLVQAVLHARLLLVEWAEEKRRIVKMAAAMLIGFACLLGLMLSLGALLLALCWDTPYRIPAMAGLIALYGLGVVLAGLRIQSQSALGAESFATTRTEFAADLELLGAVSANSATELSPHARRADLRARLQAQRLIIQQQLGIDADEPDGYPRSKTMRLLTGRPGMVLSVLGGLATLFRRR